MKASPGKHGRLSQHFTSSELECPHCHACIVQPELVLLLERIRRIVGKPLPIIDGYRCPTHNYAVGGAADSQHMYGTAADLPAGLVDMTQARNAGAVGIGRSHGFAVHVDVRRGAHVEWVY